jgi:hypothetical protein
MGPKGRKGKNTGCGGNTGRGGRGGNNTTPTVAGPSTTAGPSNAGTKALAETDEKSSLAKEVALEVAAKKLAKHFGYDDQGDIVLNEEYINKEVRDGVRAKELAEERQAKSPATTGGNEGDGGQGGQGPGEGSGRRTRRGPQPRAEEQPEEPPEQPDEPRKEQTGEERQGKGKAEAVEKTEEESEKKDLAKDWVRIVVLEHSFRTIYSKAEIPDDGEELPARFSRQHRRIIPPLNQDGLDKQMFMMFSHEARDHFTYNPDSCRLPLPVKYPRKHVEGKKIYEERDDKWTAFVKPEPIQNSIVPWLHALSALRPGRHHRNTFPRIGRPEELRDKINLYNSMLQLGIPKFFQRKLIEELCMDIYSARLSEDVEDFYLLEMTIGRFNAQTVPVLDPVLCCLTGSFGLRDSDERREIRPYPYRKNQNDSENRPYSYGLKPFKRESRTATEKPEDDELILPPKRPVIGHCLKHWSGVRENGDRRAAHVGYPLHIGPSIYYHVRGTKRQKTDHPGGPPPRDDSNPFADPDSGDPDPGGPSSGEQGVVVSDQYDLLRPTIYLRNLPGRPRDGDAPSGNNQENTSTGAQNVATDKGKQPVRQEGTDATSSSTGARNVGKRKGKEAVRSGDTHVAHLSRSDAHTNAGHTSDQTVAGDDDNNVIHT